jgi:hypothetical protein
MVNLSFSVFRFFLQILLECGDFGDRLILSDNLMVLGLTLSRKNFFPAAELFIKTKLAVGRKIFERIGNTVQ